MAGEQAGEKRNGAGEEAFPGDARWQLVERIAASPHLRRSKRLQELLLFTARRALSHPGSPIREQEIGAEVFDRESHYDTSADTIVRVHIFQLRKRLKEYFEAEGAAEPLVVEIPKGSYSPEFVPRAAPEAAGEAAVAQRSWKRRLLPVLAGLALVLGGAELGWQLHARHDRKPDTVADTFFRQMFGNGKVTALVMADASLTMFEDILQRNISVQEYQLRQWDALKMQIEDPARRDLARILMDRFYTNFSEAVAISDLRAAATRNGVLWEIVFARDFSARRLQNDNVILNGTPRANPWMKFFESKLDYQYDYDDGKRLGLFRNLRPRPGEPEKYPVSWDRQGYCRIAYLPNLSHSGTVLLLTGSDLSSAETGARFMTSDDWISRVRQRLSIAPGKPIPYFEALLRTDLAVAAAPGFELIAVRAHPE